MKLSTAAFDVIINPPSGWDLDSTRIDPARHKNPTKSSHNRLQARTAADTAVK